jgi:hypothetical protein
LVESVETGSGGADPANNVPVLAGTIEPSINSSMTERRYGLAAAALR